jgi:uncharacterized membrane protein SpoIIM required for sporulation
MFYQADVLGESMSAIWIHGAMEIFAMVIEASAGILLGVGWLFPGSLTRKQAFIANGKQSLMIVLSTIPFTICAGLLEGFITQFYNEFPLVITMTIIFGTLGVISFYYLIYPILLNKRLGSTFHSVFLNENTDEA